MFFAYMHGLPVQMQKTTVVDTGPAKVNICLALYSSQRKPQCRSNA